MIDPSLEASVDAAERGDDPKILVWDLPTRLFHWLAIVLIAAAYATWRLNLMMWHARIGYTLLAVVLFRLLWGFFGGETARFGSFIAAPMTALRYLNQVLRSAPEPRIGHNPAGGWMVLLLIFLMLAQALTGLYVDNDIADEGPLTEFVPARVANAIAALHDNILWDTLVAAIALHVLAIAFYAGKGANLVAPMITGRAETLPEARQPRMVGVVRAIVLFALSALATAALVRFV